jgi:hypothetical protein
MPLISGNERPTLFPAWRLPRINDGTCRNQKLPVATKRDGGDLVAKTQSLSIPAVSVETLIQIATRFFSDSFWPRRSAFAGTP